MHVAAMLGHRFSIIVPTRKCIPKMLDNARIYGLESRLASMRPVEIPVVTLRANADAGRDRIVDECKQAIEKDLAEVIIL